MYKLLMSNCLRNSHTKKHRNRLIFDKVIGKIKGGCRFLDTVYMYTLCLKKHATVYCDDNSSNLNCFSKCFHCWKIC